MTAVAGTEGEVVEEEKKEKGREKGKKGVELSNYPSSSHQNYCFTHGVVFVSKIVCLLIISVIYNLLGKGILLKNSNWFG